MDESLVTKKGRSELEQAAEAWEKYGNILGKESYARLMSRKFNDVTWTEYVEVFVTTAYARGRAGGLREALRILGREE